MPTLYWRGDDGEEESESFTEGDVRRGEYREAKEGLIATGQFIREEK